MHGLQTLCVHSHQCQNTVESCPQVFLKQNSSLCLQMSLVVTSPCPSPGKVNISTTPLQSSPSQAKDLFCKGIKLSFLMCNPLALQAEQTDLRQLRSHIIKQCTTHFPAKGDLCTREYESQHWVIHMALFNYAWHYKEGKLTFPLFF